MRKILVLSLVALLFMASASYAIGGSRIGKEPLEATTVWDDATSHVHISTTPVDVYRVTLTSVSTAAYFVMYDSASMGILNERPYTSALGAPKSYGDNASTTLQQRNVKADIGVGTANQSHVIDYTDHPMRFHNGLYVGWNGLGQINEARATIEWAPAE